ncbi:MAG: efflux RND transporter periplasmic adaptor subunit [Bacteroidetes bacterium]|nr:efflux RND transporter periplasmic adaptor subunit [Bacteroidota bacterium]
MYLNRASGLLMASLALFAGRCGQEDAALPNAPVDVPPSLQEAAGPVLVELTPEQLSVLSIETVSVESTDDAVAIDFPARVEPSPESFGVVSAPIGGRISQILAHEGEAVRKGQVVARIESAEYGALVADLVETRAERDFADSQVQRYTALVSDGISPRARLEEAAASLKRADARRLAAEARLKAIGVSNLDEATSSAMDPRLPVFATRSGFVDRREIDLGQSVSAYDELLTIVGNEEVLVVGQASPAQARRISTGDKVSITSATPDGRIVEAAVTSVSPAVDSASRSVSVYVRTRPDGLRPGERVRMRVHPQGTVRAMRIPLSAVAFDGDNAIVFVKTAANTFERRSLDVGEPVEGSVAVYANLSDGEEIAVSNVFDLKALARYSQYGEE